MNKENVTEKICEVVLSIRPSDGRPCISTKFTAMGFDSLDINTLFAEIENLFDLEVNIDVAMELENIDDVVTYIMKRISIEQK